MIQKLIFKGVLVLAALAGLLGAQQAAEAPAAAAAPSSPVAKQPAIKSQKELEAIQAILQAPDDQARIAAANALITGFANSEWKGFALQMATVSYQMLNDYENLLIYGDRTLEADPDNYTVMLAMSAALAQRTREFDLDKEEKLARATAHANRAIEILETAPRPNPNITDEQWEEAKGDFRSQAYESLGLIALVRKDFPEAVKEFKLSIDNSSIANPGTQVRLAVAYNQTGNPGEAITTLDSVLATPDLHPSIRSVAQAERARAIQAQKK
jgi:tetratricopeptide (TPR) repeat protein